jgi:N-acetylmuramoyl-L-alanine amidase
LRRVAIPSPNYSSRGGSTVTTIVLHTAEGALTYQSLGSFFQNPASGVSSHVGIDDTPNTVGEYVPRSGNAWTAAAANSWSVQAELCAFASWTPDIWATHPNMLANTAAWIAEEAAALGIPLVKLSPADAQNPAARGVCQHNDLGNMGGGHWDCGPGFPIDQVLAMAAGGAPPAAGPAPKQLFASGQEDAQVALTTGPNGMRVDLLFVAPNGNLEHWYAPNPAELATQPAKENLGGQVRPGGGVSGGWTADGNYYVVTVEGGDNRPYIRSYDAVQNKWGGWNPVGDPNTLRT